MNDLKAFLLEGDQQGFNIENIPKAQMRQFLMYQMSLFDEKGDLKRRPGSGRPNLAQDKVDQIIQLAANKKYSSSRNVAAQVGVAPSTVTKKLHKSGYKSLSLCKSQGMKQNHMDQR